MSTIKAIVCKREASVETGPKTRILWRGRLPVVPRPGEFVLVKPDYSSGVVDRVDWDLTTKPITVEIWVR